MGGGNDSGGSGSGSYDYDKLTASGFSGIGLDYATDVTAYNGTWTRITTTDDATLQANGFKTEQWQLDGGSAILLHNGSEWAVMSPTTLIIKSISPYATPWDVPVGEWVGEVMLPVGTSSSFTKTEGNSGGDGGGNTSGDWHYLKVSGFDTNVDGIYELTSGDGSDRDFVDCKWAKQGGGMYLSCLYAMEWAFMTGPNGTGTYTYGAVWAEGGPWACDWGNGHTVERI